MNLSRMLQPTGSIGASLPFKGPTEKLSTRGLRVKVNADGTIKALAPILGSLVGELILDRSMFLCTADTGNLDDYPVELSGRDLGHVEWISHPFVLSLLVAQASGGDVEAVDAIDTFLRKLFEYDQMALALPGSRLAVGQLTLTPVYDLDVYTESDFSLWEEDFDANNEQFHWGLVCECSSRSLLNRFRSGLVNGDFALPRLLGILINNNGPQPYELSQAQLDSTVPPPSIWNEPARMVNGLHTLNSMLVEPIASGVSWEWEDLAISHGSGWLPGLGLDMITQDRTVVVDGIKDLWFLFLMDASGTLERVPDPMCTDSEEGDLVTSVVTHLFTHARDLLDTVLTMSTLLGRSDVLYSCQRDSLSECHANLIRAKIKSVYRQLSHLSVQQMEIDSEETRMRALVSQIFADQMEE